ncbi:unnamed protein product, partial [Polarella glacialis]
MSSFFHVAVLLVVAASGDVEDNAADVLGRLLQESRQLGESEVLDSKWYYDERCECCSIANGVPLRNFYRMNVHKNCFGGGVGSIGMRMEDVLAQTPDGTLTLGNKARELVCASHLCKGAIAAFWDTVHGCAASGYWKTIALAHVTAVSQCNALQQLQPKESARWITRMSATFRGVDTTQDGSMLRAEAAAELSAQE